MTPTMRYIQEQTVEVVCRTDLGGLFSATVPAHLPAAGLAVHRGYEDDRSWVVTHTPTGRSLAVVDTEAAAIALAQWLAPVAKWESIRTYHDLSREQIRRVRELVRAYGGEA